VVFLVVDVTSEVVFEDMLDVLLVVVGLIAEEDETDWVFDVLDVSVDFEDDF
jgi:hypothetical protein